MPKLLAATCLTLLCASAGLRAGQDPPLASLQALAPQAGRTQVMVVGTFHFREVAPRFQPAMVAPLLDRLAAFKPEVIAVEVLPGPHIHELEARGQATMIHQQVLEHFASTQLELGHAAQKVLNLDPIQATRALGTLPPPGDPAAMARRALNFLAAYELPSALLAWSGVPATAQAARAQVPQTLAAKLDAQLALVNEVPQLALPLANRLGLSELRCVDEFEAPEEQEPVILAYLAAAKESPLLAAKSKAPHFQATKARREAALEQGNFLPFFRFLNAPATIAADVAAQWGVYLRSHLQNGSDRGRLAMWENRNLKIAARIRALSASHPGQRILVIYGAAHKPFLDAYLATCSDLRVVQPESLLQ